jgi:hypothetical protein
MRHLLGIVIFFTMGFAQAAPVQYVFEGVGTGTLAGVAFTNATFKFEFSGDTAAIQDAPGFPGLPVNPIANGEFSVTGFASGVLTEIWAVYNSPFNQPLASIGIARLPDGTNGFFGTFAGMTTYGLDTTVEPITASSAGMQNVFPGTSNVFFTTIGNLDFSSVSALTFSATVVPIPSAIWLFVSGLAILRWLRRTA